MDLIEKYNLEIEKSLVVSTAHITKEDDELLTQETKEENIHDQLLYPQAVDYGYYISTIEELEPKMCDLLLETGYSPALLSLLRLAHEIGCQYLRLDRDGEIYDEFPQFDW